MRIVRTGFIKSDIPRYPHPTSNRVIATITLMLRAVAKKNTLNGLSSQFSAFTRRKKDKTDTSKTSEVTVTGSMTKKALIRCTPLKNRGGLPVNEEDSSRDSLSPEVRWKLRRKE